MSDIILKFWPKADTEESNVQALKIRLLDSHFIGQETNFEGKPAFKPGPQFNLYFEPILTTPSTYIESLVVTIAEKDYGVVEGEEEFDYIDRNNVISIFGGDGIFEKWDKVTDLLQQITGNEYQGGYELL